MTLYLLDEVEAATAGSRRLDAEIAKAFGAEVTDTHGRLRWAFRNAPWLDFDTRNWMTLPDLSGSLREAWRFAEAIAPNTLLTVSAWTRPAGKDAIATLERFLPIKGTWQARAATPALAIIAALIRSGEAGL